MIGKIETASGAGVVARAGSGLFRAVGAAFIPRHWLVRLLVRRLVLALPLLVIVTAMSFVLLSLTPGNAAQQILGLGATPAKLAALKHQLGLDGSLPSQYLRWLGHALHGNLGSSLYTGEAVAPALVQRLGVSLALIVTSLLAIVLIGVPLGTFSAVRGGRVGRLVDGLALIGFALPSFWVGAVLIELFAVKIHAFPAVGYVSIGTSPWQWLRSITLPVVALSLGGVVAVAKQTREAMLHVLASEHIRMARANGIPPRRIYFVYALKNVGIRVSTIMGLLTVGLFGGTVFVETIFALPGLGSFAASGGMQQDIPVVEGVMLVFTGVIVLVNLITDVAYAWLDPRARPA